MLKALPGPKLLLEEAKIIPLPVKYFPFCSFSLAWTIWGFNAFFFFFPSMQISVGNCTLIWTTLEILRQFLFSASLLIQEVAVYFLLAGTPDSLKSTQSTKVTPIMWDTAKISVGPSPCLPRSSNKRVNWTQFFYPLSEKEFKKTFIRKLPEAVTFISAKGCHKRN